MNNLFSLNGKIALITGGGGLLGPQHAEAIIEAGGRVILTDWHEDRAAKKAAALNEKIWPRTDNPSVASPYGRSR